ncbi:hypothetical protein ACIBBG_33075 [Micromonospora chersina]|uniref:hypothetical protein n=1 Tax=Micromonospora chersina TaxID=47854 RepID=UPI00378D552C
MTHDLDLALRDSLTSAADALTTPDDPWPHFSRRETARRRVRRVRGTVFAGVLAAAVGVQTNVVPLPSWTPSIAVAAPWAGLADAPTRGSLAGDRVWLDGLRGHIKGLRDSEGLWEVAGRDRIRVLYAGDIPGHRLAIALVPLRLGVFMDWTVMFYKGPVGAAPAEMVEDGNTDARSPVVFWAQGDATNGGAAVVVGPPGSAVTINKGFTYSPQGVIDYQPTTASGANGVAVAQLPPSPVDPGTSAQVTNNGKVIFEGGIVGGWNFADDGSHEVTDAMLAAAVKGSRGPGLEPAILATFVQSALQDSRLSAKDVTVHLRWSGTINGQPAALLTLQPHNGGVLAYAMHGNASSWRTDLRLLLPADKADQRPLAWRVRANGSDAMTDKVIVVAPAAAAAVRLTIDGGPSDPVAIDSSGYGTTTVPPGKRAAVTAFAADGTTLPTTPVPLGSDFGGLPGASPDTRVVK